VYGTPVTEIAACRTPDVLPVESHVVGDPCHWSRLRVPDGSESLSDLHEHGSVVILEAWSRVVCMTPNGAADPYTVVCDGVAYNGVGNRRLSASDGLVRQNLPWWYSGFIMSAHANRGRY
jgi:hypothetical protein